MRGGGNGATPSTVPPKRSWQQQDTMSPRPRAPHAPVGAGGVTWLLSCPLLPQPSGKGPRGSAAGDPRLSGDTLGGDGFVVMQGPGEVTVRERPRPDGTELQGCWRRARQRDLCPGKRPSFGERGGQGLRAINSLREAVPSWPGLEWDGFCVAAVSVQVMAGIGGKIHPERWR